MAKKKSNISEPSEVSIDETKRNKAIDMLEEAMVFWHDEGIKIIKGLQHLLNMEGKGREAAQLAMLWKGVDDRWIEIASKLAPYQSPKLSSIENKNEVVVKHIVRPYARAKDHKEWLERVQEDEKYLPKAQVVQNLFSDHTIDDIEFERVNEEEGQEVH
jgi:hypothetical protein